MSVSVAAADPRPLPFFPSPSTQSDRSRRAEVRVTAVADDPSAAIHTPSTDSNPRHVTRSIGPPSTASPSLGNLTHHTVTAATPRSSEPTINPRFEISEERKGQLLGLPGAPSTNFVVHTTAHFIVRTLKVWPRMLATHSSTGLIPPIIHQTQSADNISPFLANCCTLVRMWADDIQEGSRDLVKSTIMREIQRLMLQVRLVALSQSLRTFLYSLDHSLHIISDSRPDFFSQYHSFPEADLVPAAQSLLLLLIILFFGFETSLTPPLSLQAELLVETWDIKQTLATTGLFLDEELEHRKPASWRDWITVSLKRRIIMSFNHLEWAWSVIHGYPALTCFELAPLPAPAAKYLWQAADQPTWERLYREWLWKWRDEGGYKMVEFFDINPSGSLNRRSDMWFAEADEFGMMLMVEGKFHPPL